MNENKCINCGAKEYTTQELNKLHICKECAEKNTAEANEDFEKELEADSYGI